MQFTGLEATLISALIASGAALITKVVSDSFFKETFVEDFQQKKDCQNIQKICNSKFEAIDKQIYINDSQLKIMNKRFEKFIIFSDLPNDVKAKILNGVDEK